MNKKRIAKLIGDGKTKQALEGLQKMAEQMDKDWGNSVTLLQARFNRNERSNGMGILTTSQYNIEVNKINNSLLALLEDIPEDANVEETPSTSSSPSNTNQSTVSGDNNTVIQDAANVNSPKQDGGVNIGTIHIHGGQVNIADEIKKVTNNENSSSNNSQSPTEIPNKTPKEKDSSSSKPKKIFISYSKSDRAHLDYLQTHLSILKRGGLIDTWFDGEIHAGGEWDSQIKQQLAEANVILCLVSAHFLATNYIWDEEIPVMMERHERGEVVVIPIIVSDCQWTAKNANGEYIFHLAKLNALPHKAKPISQHDNIDEAWTGVVRGIERVIKA